MAYEESPPTSVKGKIKLTQVGVGLSYAFHYFLYTYFQQG